MSIDSQISDAAFAAAQAQVHVQRANAGLATAVAEHEKIAERVAALTTQRAEIIARRGLGDTRPTDGADLELIAADQQGLAGILDEAEAVVTAARGPVQAARQAWSNAHREMQLAEDAAALAQLVEHAGKLDGLLLATVSQITDTQGRLGQTGRPAWAPSKDLYIGLRKLTSATGGL
jgi:hypothetical protein